MKKINGKMVAALCALCVMGTSLCGCGSMASSLSATPKAEAGSSGSKTEKKSTKSAKGTEAKTKDKVSEYENIDNAQGAENYNIYSDGEKKYNENNGEETEYGIERKYKDLYDDEDYNNSEEYRYISENGYKSVRKDPLSTFSIDVDTASYSNIRRMINNNESIPEDAVRVEEMINYFSYDYPEPNGDDPFSVTTEYSDCPWDSDSRLMLIGLKAKDIDFSDRPSNNFVFLLDVSGSMQSEDKLPLVQKSFEMLAENLTENDRISIVTYAGYESVVLEGERGDNYAKIADALDSLEAGGSTAGSAGIKKAYELAEQYYIEGGNNRVILATDGDLNVGITSESGLTKLITAEKESGVHLSVLGFGTGNIKDNKMEALADNGDGNYNYIDSLYEAKKVLVDEMGGTLVTVAKDVKIQVEFNPSQVSGYRLVGYEDRLLDDQDFNDDSVDAGEIGSGHTVTALYEIVPQNNADTENDELLTVSIRYKQPNGNKSKLMTNPVDADSYEEDMSGNLEFASSVAEFAMVLRNSENKGSSSFDSALELAENSIDDAGYGTVDDYREEYLELINKAKKHNKFEE